MNTKEMAASIIAIMMVAAIFVTTAAAFTAPNAKDDRVEFEYGVGDCDGLYVNARDHCNRQVNIVHKDVDWNVLDDPENGVLTYQIDEDGMLTYSYNNPLAGYVLFVPDCETGGMSGWIPGTGQPGKVLSGSDDISAQLGFVDDGVDYNGEVYGAKIWYVPTSIVTDNPTGTDYVGPSWPQSDMLFEEDLIVPTTLTTLRIYGEDSYDAAFPYTDPEAPFDPTKDEVPEKDFVVFNPAYMEGHAWPQYIKIDTGSGMADANEKIFVRQWYVPKYLEPRGNVWLDSNYYDISPSPDIVTEYSFMLLKDKQGLSDDNYPTYGYAGNTRLYLPIGSNGSQIGLDSFEVLAGSGVNEIVEIKEIDDFSPVDGLKDINVGTTGAIAVAEGERAEFIDHEVHVKKLYMGASGWMADMSIYYIGNDASFPESGAHAESPMQVSLDIGESAVAGRGTAVKGDPQSFDMPWKVTLVGVDIMGDTTDALITVERRIHMGETFFVDGAEYDVAMIYGPEENSGEFTTFKYITIRNPTPKYDEVYLNGLSIWKQPVEECDVIPMLPPFNMEHTMIDDINCYTFCPDPAENCDQIEDDTTSIDARMISGLGPLEPIFVDEDIELRFHTNLLEILKEQTPEIWQWLHIHIMPDRYTEIYYPPLPDAAVCDSEGDFLLVSSWEAPNSCDDRMKFAHDADNSDDIYVNEQVRCGTNSVRIYGENSYDAAFPYTDAEGPFNKLSVDAPRKDFVTFNPAYMDGHALPQYIKVDTGSSMADANEKIFVRQWYVPEYLEPRGDVWLDSQYYDINPSPDIVTEYSFMLLKDKDGSFDDNYPTYGYAGNTRLYLPIGSNDSQIGLDSFEVLAGSGVNEIVEIKEIDDFSPVDGLKDINVGTTGAIAVAEGERAEFIDHEVHVKKLYMGASGWMADMSIYYIGNDASFPESGAHAESPMQVSLDIGESAVAGRGTAVKGDPQSFDMPWKVTLVGVDIMGDTTDALITVERRIHMGETFFVDGAEYDVAMIYGPEENSGEFTTFKYITIRNPTPKYDEVYLNGLSIWKQPVDECEKIPMLPPFNMEHTIVDDIGIPHYAHGLGDTMYDEPYGISACANTVEERLVPLPGSGDDLEQPFVSYFVDETVEERFRTNLLEILDEGTTESWDMLCMWTHPWAYTEMVYPDVGDCNCCNDPNADFLVTTSGPKDVPPYTPARLEGDVTNTGLPITGADAQLVAKDIVGAIELTGEDAQAADVNDDMGGVTPNVTGADLQLIMKFAVGAITEFPGGEYIP